ncbi:hypothetical protein PYW07_001407 [Mythimna separata]|uniref:E3 ubiquitin-protein ligase listerin n=1 Tax=Mythimna separata TaxID=271217 RepID=A0AAD7YTJ1_MYTSE|nr:hypothetical protein PYW07_001407 [Mythimna separata]
MGGKTKQSQRTKNNVRPSSSSRSAELLSGGISLDGGLMSLGGGKPLPPLFPTLAAANLEQGLNPEFQMCIKKLNKKDPITRAKALNELCELVNNGDVEDVVAALPSWAHFYKTLTADTDRKVREMTQVCHGAIVRVCGRRTAPQLKALLPAWLQAQYDDHAPAQAQAHLSLTSTFPDSKLPEVISFCKAEVMMHLLDNLNGNTEAIVTKRIENVEERQLVLSRLTTSSLQGLQYFCAHLPAAHDAWLWQQLQPLLAAPAYWKLAQAQPQIRAAWYGATGRLIERYRETWGAQYGAKTLRVLLEGAKEQTGHAAAPLWTCLLQLMHNVQDWHTYLDKKELLVKRILSVLENGGWGDARHLSNMLLPLLAYLPQDILTKDFYEAFFNAVFTGLEKKNILNSKSERQSWITSLAECLRYLSIQQHEFVLEVVSGVQRAWLRAALSPREHAARAGLVRCSAAAMADLLKYWLKQSKQEHTDKYDQLIRNFWQNVGATVLTQIDKSGTDPEEIEKLIEGHILLLQTLKTSFSQEVKKKHSIKFDGDAPVVTEKSAVVTPQCDAALVERYKHNLDDAVHKICAHYLDSAEKKQMSSAIVTPVYTLLVEFDSKQLFVALARQFDVDSVFRLYDKVFRSWLAGDTMRCKTLVDIVFLLMKYMTEEEQDAMFDTFQQFPPVVVERCVCAAVRHPHVLAPASRRWLRGTVVRDQLRALAGRAALHADRDAAALLVACLADVPTGELLVSEESVSEVLKTVSSAISQPHSSTLEASSALAARLATALQEHAAPQYAPLVLQLFRLNILVPRGDSRLSLDTWCEVRSSWQDGVAALPDSERVSFLQQAAEFLREQLFDNLEKLDITKIENIVSVCPHLFNRCDDADVPDDITDMLAFIKQIFDMEGPEALAVEASALRHQCVTCQLNCLYDDDNDAIATIVRDSAKPDVKELTKTDLLLYVTKHLFRAIHLRTLLLHRINSDEDDDEPSEQRTWCDALLKHEDVQTEFCNVLYTYSVIYSLHEGYAFWAHYDIIVETKQKLESLLADVAAASSAETRGVIASRLAERALARGYLWALAHRWFQRHAPDPNQDILDGQKLDDIISGNGYFHTLQASTKWCTEPDAEAAYKIKYLVMLRSWYIAFGERGDAELLRDVTRARAACDLDVVVNAYYKRTDTMLYDKDITDSPWSEVVSNVAVLEFLSTMVEARGWEARAPHWDFTTISLCSLLASVRKSTRSWGSTKVCMLSRAVLRLWALVRRFAGALPAECARRQPAAHVAALLSEWRDIFSPDTTYNLLYIIMHVLDSCGESEMTSPQIEVVDALIACTKLLDWDAVAAAHKHDALSLQRLARTASDALLTPAHHAHMHLAYHLLLALSKPLVLADAEKLKLWSEEGGEGEEELPRPQLCIDYFHLAFGQLYEIVNAALSSVVLGEGTCEFVAMSDSYNMALGWLLLADVLATLCGLARGDLTHHYIQIYRERGYAEPLVTAALRLLPLGVFAYAEDATGATPAPPHYQDMFLTIKDFSVHEPARGGDVSALACRALYRVLCGAGTGGARGWWGAAPARAARLLERVVLAYVAPPAARDQLMHLHQRAHEIEDTEIRIAWSSNEVTCVYNVEERLIELRVWLARAHPLAAPRLAAPHASGPGANTHWVSLYLAYQNGTLLNALKMWTRAVSAKVESSPQCYICYCRLHPHTGRLPRVLCNQCKNKFHTNCLRKWFTTSNKSNCPLCRSAF